MSRHVGRLRGQRREEGAVAILVALTLVMLLGFAAFTVDTGHLMQVRNELQNVSDSAALAGARHLDGASSGIAAAKSAAEAFADQHKADNSAMEATKEIKVEFGHWWFSGDDPQGACTDGRSTAPCFQNFGETVGEGVLSAINAVRVTSYRVAAAARNNKPVRHYFAQFIGKTQDDVFAQAIAVGGGPFIEECSFPIVVPDCQVSQPATDGTCQWCMQFQSANTDNGGWTTFATEGHCGTTEVKDKVVAACSTIVDDECASCSQAGSKVGDSIQICNGNGVLNPSAQSTCAFIKSLLLRDGEPKAFRARVPVVDSGGMGPGCNFQFSGNGHKIVGYITMEFYGVNCGNQDCDGKTKKKGGEPDCVIVEEAMGDCTPPPSGKFITAKLLCDQYAPGAAGGGNFGTYAPHIRLVR